MVTHGHHHGRGSGIPITEMPVEHQHLEVAIAQHHRLEEINRRLFSYSHPVDEWQSSLGEPAGTQIEVLPTYEWPELINAITVITNPASQGLVLELGDRTMPIVSGVFHLPNCGITLDRVDRRILSWTSLAGTGFYFGLTGWAINPVDTA